MKDTSLVKPVRLSAAAALEFVQGWTDLTDARRRNLVVSLETVCRICERPAAADLMECGWLNTRLFVRPPAAFDLKKSRFSDVICDLRYILERLGRHAARDRAEAGLSDGWIRLWNLVPERNRRAAMSLFMHYASAAGIEPEDVDADLLAVFEPWVVDNVIHDKIPVRVRGTRYAWRDARATVAGWPSVELVRPSRRLTYVMALEDFPQAFREDVESYLESLRRGFTGTLFQEVDPSVTPPVVVARRRRRKPARATTVATRLYQIRLAATALVLAGVPIKQLVGLRDLVEPASHATTIIKHFWQKNGEKPGSHVAGVNEVLRQIAVHHCRSPACSVETILNWAAMTTPRQGKGMTERNRKRLSAMNVQPAYGKILNLPTVLMAEAMDAKRDSSRTAVMAMRAAMLEILLVCPMRRETLRLLRLDEHLLRLGPGARIVTHFWVPGWMTKTGAPLHWPVPEQTGDLLEIWIKRFRPTACDPDNPYLFGGLGKLPMSGGGLSTTILDVFAQRVGIAVNMHLMRHFAAWLYLKVHPGSYAIVSMVLGHSSEETTKNFYTGLEIDAAARHFDAVVMGEREATRLDAMAALAPKKNRRRPNARSR